MVSILMLMNLIFKKKEFHDVYWCNNDDVYWGESMVKWIEKVVISKAIKNGPIFDKSQRK
jgi:hypothetical protein